MTCVSNRQSTASAGTANDRIYLRIADVTYGMASVDPTMRFQVHEPVSRFQVAESRPDVTIDARWDDLSVGEPKGAEVFHSGSVWRLAKNGGNYIFTLTSPAFGPVPYKVARIKDDFSRGEVRIHRPYCEESEGVYPLEYPLDELLMIHVLSTGKGVEFHATGVADSAGTKGTDGTNGNNRRGYLFVGQSGAGKTTMARLWENRPGVTVLSDDRIVVRKIDGRLWMYGTPWHGDAALSSPQRVPLCGVFLLKHGPANALTALKPVEAAGRLFSCGFFPFYDPSALQATLAVLEDLVSTVACRELAFRPDDGVIEFVRAEGLTAGA